jgi:hypothetical protein
VPLQVVGDAGEAAVVQLVAAVEGQLQVLAERVGARGVGWRPGRARRRAGTPGPRPTAVPRAAGSRGRQRRGTVIAHLPPVARVAERGPAVRCRRTARHGAVGPDAAAVGQLHDDRSADQQRAVHAEDEVGPWRGRHAAPSGRAPPTTTSSSTRSPGAMRPRASSIGARERITGPKGTDARAQHVRGEPAAGERVHRALRPAERGVHEQHVPPGATASRPPCRSGRAARARPSRRPSSAPAGAGEDVALGRHVGRVGDEQVEPAARTGRTGRRGARPASGPRCGRPAAGPAA